MFQKFCIVLFITIICNGVAYSSPIKANASDLISKEQASATETVSHINHKIEPNNTAPDAGVHQIENPKPNTSANDSITENKPISNQTKVDPSRITPEENIKQGFDTKNDNKTAMDAIKKIPNATFNGTISNNTMPTATTPASVPVTLISSTTDLPPRTLSDMSRPIVAGQNTTPTTLAAGTPTKAPVSTPTVPTPTPAPAVSTSTGNVIQVQNSSKKAQESRFDGASFVGGIVLTIGLTAIGFIAFKYYKSGKIDGNYRSL